jgi:hypothetical protein
MLGHSGGDPGRFGLNVYEDGRVIWQKLGDLSEGGDRRATGLIEQHLTSEGVELIRSEVLSTGLLDRDRYLVGAYLPYFGAIEVPDGDRLLQVSWGDIGPRTGPETPATPSRRTPSRSSARAWRTSPPGCRRAPGRTGSLGPTWRPGTRSATRPSRGRARSRAGLAPTDCQDALRPLERTHGEYGGDSGFGSAYDYWCSTVTTEQARGLAGPRRGWRREQRRRRLRAGVQDERS